MTSKNGIGKVWTAAILVLIAAIATLPIFIFGVTSSNDIAQNFQRAVTIHDGMLAGDPFPAIGSATNDGLGDLAVRFYPPLAYTVMSVLTIVTGDWYTGTIATYFLLFVLGGAGMFLWSREILSNEHAFMAAAIYMFAPYHLNLIYNNGLIAEFAAASVLPFCFHFVTRICGGAGLYAIVGLAASSASLILTHLPSTVIGSIAIIIYALLMLDRRASLNSLLKLAVAAGLGVAASSFYWTRMLPELDWVRHSGPEYFSGIYGFQMNFLLSPANWPATGDDQLGLWVADLMLIAIIAVVLPAAIYYLKEGARPSRSLAAVSAVFAFSVFMTTPLSYFVWHYIGPIQRVQFPWRWLGIVSATGAIIASTGIVRLSKRMREDRQRTIAAVAAISLAFFVFMSVLLARQAVYLSRSDFHDQIDRLGSSPSYVGWLPTWATPMANAPAKKIDAGDRAADIAKWDRYDRVGTIEDGDPVDAVIANYYYPRWHAYSNGSEIEIYPDRNGLIATHLPAGRIELELRFVEPHYVTAAYFISGFLWAFFLSVGIARSIKYMSAGQTHTGGPNE